VSRPVNAAKLLEPMASEPVFRPEHPNGLFGQVAAEMHGMGLEQMDGGHRLSLDELGAVVRESAERRGLTEQAADAAVRLGMRWALQVES